MRVRTVVCGAGAVALFVLSPACGSDGGGTAGEIAGAGGAGTFATTGTGAGGASGATSGAGATTGSSTSSGTSGAGATTSTASSGAGATTGSGTTIGGGAETAAFASGSRLHATVLDAGGGAVALEGFQDSALGEACAFQPTTDGATRCVPVGDGIDTWFSDASCTAPLVVRPPQTACGAAPHDVLVQEGAAPACSDRAPTVSVHPVGGAIAASRAYVRLSDGTCVQQTLASGTEVRSVGPAIDPAQFVAARTVTEAVDASLAVRALVGDDGSRVVIGTVDRQRNAVCVQGLASNLGDRCVPAHTALGAGLYADASCSDLLASVPVALGACGDVDTALVPDTSNACTTPTATLRTLGAATSGPVFAGGDGACSEVAAPGGTILHRMGAAIPASTLPALTSADLGSGRVVVRVPAAPDGTVLAPSGAFVDTQAGARCVLAPTATGLACLPPDSRALDVQKYADASCTKPAVRVDAGNACASPVPPIVFTIDPACGTVSSMWRVDPTPLSTVYAVFSDGCGSFQDPSGTYYAVGAKVDPSAFPAITRRTVAAPQ